MTTDAAPKKINWKAIVSVSSMVISAIAAITAVTLVTLTVREYREFQSLTRPLSETMAEKTKGTDDAFSPLGFGSVHHNSSDRYMATYQVPIRLDGDDQRVPGYCTLIFAGLGDGWQLLSVDASKTKALAVTIFDASELSKTGTNPTPRKIWETLLKNRPSTPAENFSRCNPDL